LTTDWADGADLRCFFLFIRKNSVNLLNQPQSVVKNAQNRFYTEGSPFALFFLKNERKTVTKKGTAIYLQKGLNVPKKFQNLLNRRFKTRDLKAISLKKVLQNWCFC
jgi:hypothetical protein